MADIRTPAFRKSMKGYNKIDVNNYIIALNRTLEDNKRLYERTLNDCNARAEADYKNLCKLSADLNEKDKEIAALKAEIARLMPAKEELDCANSRIAELEKALEDAKSNSSEYYESVCSKAGEILFIASNTAENILNHANDEAQRIVGDANNKKDIMLKTFSDSVDAAADDINVYIKSAVEECIKRIDKSVKEVSEMANPEKKMKPKAHFINEN